MSDAPTVFRQTDLLDPDRARALQAALGIEANLDAGAALPPFFHQIYFWTALPPEKLGRDGHPARGQGAIPDLGLPRRMWAGGRLQFHAPLILGQAATCETRTLRAVHKDGRSGPLGIVTLALTYHQDGVVCVTEERDLIYRQEADPTKPRSEPPVARVDAIRSRPVQFDTTLLFRYSALTFNGHRIHYDLDYATQVEGYDGLVVHGPLLAQMLMLFAEETLGPVATFSFRATAPLMHFEEATLCLNGFDLWVRGPDGRLCMEAQVQLR